MARRKPQSKKLSKKLWYGLLAGFVIPACSGGGCSSCGGVTPLPGGFSNDARVENAASVRITQKGFDFLESNIGTIAGNVIGGGSSNITFPINETSGSIPIPIFPDIDYTVCPGGPTDNPLKCKVEIDLANASLAIDSGNPHNINVVGYIPIRLQDLPISTGVGDLDVTISGNQQCPGGNQTYANIGLTVSLSVETDLDASHARYGYSRLRIASIQPSKTDIENSLKFCGGFTADVVDFFKGYIVDYAFDGLVDTLKSSLEDQLCQKANPDVSPSCPNGTNDVDGVCRYGTTSDDECVSMVLGTDGHADLGGLLASLSPGTKGGMDFLFAAGGPSQRDDATGFTWGDLNPIGGGATVSMFGGVEPNPISKCVPQANVPRPSGLQIPSELIDDSLITDWPVGTPGPHVGFGISESFFNYALAGMYNSGLLCIGLSTETVDLLNSSTLALLAQSLRDLGLQREPQPIAIMLKPRQPPHVTFGNGTSDSDPLITLSMPEATFDFYILSSDRYIRFMSATFDITAPVNLTVTPDGLVPTLDKMDIANGKIENSDLLREDPAVLAASLQSLLSSQIGTLIGSGLPAIDVNGALSGLGLKLVIPETVEGQGSPGLRTLQKNGERYLAIFAALEAVQTMSLETDATIDMVHIDPDGLSGETLRPDNAPSVQIHASVADDHGKPVEHQVRVDGGMWKPWTRSDVITVQDESFRLQGKHVVEVRSRNQGDAYSLDVTPAALDIVIDKVAPEVKIAGVTEEGTTKLDVFDLVSRDASMVRYKFDDGDFTSWKRAGELAELKVPEDATEITVEAKDESGNVGQAQQAIIRGLPHGTGGGCGGCAVPGSNDNGSSPKSA
ncbi:MAG TPA: hypothetical protein VL400_18740, partial [Polyangiaceae bacterium]|nr:hypothetical protein [Polyangiaceae bacterium]